MQNNNSTLSSLLLGGAVVATTYALGTVGVRHMQNTAHKTLVLANAAAKSAASKFFEDNKTTLKLAHSSS